jgi:hypothetical protein
LLLLAALVAWLFWPAIGGQASFAFRDAAHFYHPLFDYIRQEWGAGRVPLWNPYENAGVPLVAENTSSVFYPGKLLFALPLDYTWLFNAYIVLHVLLAAGTSYALARHFSVSVLAAGVAALSYAFCGNVLFQYCNVIFLVGAAWLPLAWLFVDRLLRQRQWTAAIGLGVVLALIVLGGDPHLAYNTALVAGGYAILLWHDERREAAGEAAGAPSSKPLRRPLYLGGALALAGLLAAIQVLPTLEAAPYSSRAKYNSPRSIYELAFVAATDTPDQESDSFLAGILGKSHSGHHDRVYSFSLEPWRAVELLWPNVTGRAFPTDCRWLSAFGLELAIWTPSLYMGLLPLLLAALAFSLRRSTAVEVRGLSWLVLFGALGSFGWYGVAWLIGLIIGDSESVGVGGEVGGLYWWLATLLPSYIQFRYPAKLFVLASLALSMLAAKGWDDVWQNGSRRLMNCLLALPLISAGVAAGALVAWPYIRPRAVVTRQSAMQGPFDWTQAWTDFGDGLLHTAILALLLAAMFWWTRRKPAERYLVQLAMLIVVAVDLATSQRSLIEYAPVDTWRKPPAILGKLPADRENFRVFRQLGPLPPSFEKVAAQQRYTDGIRWDRETLRPKYPLPLHVSLAEASQSVAGFDYEQFLAAARRQNRRKQSIDIPDPSILDLTAARVVIVDGSALTQLTDPEPIADGMYVAQRTSALPRAWIVHDVEVRPTFRGRSLGVTENYTFQLLFPEREQAGRRSRRPESRDWRQIAVVETDEPFELHRQADAITDGETCSIEYADPLRVEIAARLQSPGLVVLSDLHYPGWELTVETAGHKQSQPILRTNRVMRGVLLPAGEHHLVYRYRPRSVLVGAIISGLTLLSLVGVTAVLYRRRQTAAASLPVGPVATR